MRPQLPPLALEDIVRRALAEDLSGGDLTTEACIDEDAQAVARAVARGSVVVCGGPVFHHVFRSVDPTLSIETAAEDGASVGPGALLWTVRGRARSILMAERVALNFVQRM